jgi:hypothetical protein
MAKSADGQGIFEIGPINTLPVVASGTIYRDSAVGLSSGYARALNAGDSFRGFADSKVDNSDGAAGAKNVDVLSAGYKQVTLTSVAITDVGKPVFMSDDETFTLTQGSNSLVGSVYRYVAANTCVIEFGGDKTLQASAVTDTAITAVTTTAPTDTTGLITAVGSLVTAVNSIITRQTSVVTALNAMLGGLKG